MSLLPIPETEKSQNTRLNLHEKLCEILGSRNCYYRAPSENMKYPCIKYNLIGFSQEYADNVRYLSGKKYSLIVIDPNPDSDIAERLVNSLPYCTMVGSPYISDNLNHFPLTLYW